MAKMKDLKYIFIGWMKEGQADKVWGAIELVAPDKSSYYATGKYLTFWGRRGKRYQTKIVKSSEPSLDYYSRHSEIGKKIQEKKDKGYKTVDKTHLENVYPDFEKDLQTTAFWTVLTKSGDLTESDVDSLWHKDELTK